MSEMTLLTDRKTLRGFALQVGAAIALLFGLVFPWLLDLPIPLWPLVGAGVLATWGLVAPATLKPVYVLWMRLGQVLHHVVSPVVLGIVFFVVFTPVALGMRLFGRDQLSRAFDDGTESYRKPSKARMRESMEKPF